MSRASEFTSPPKRILVPIDGSDNSKRALNTAIILSKAFGAQIEIVNVIPAPGLLVEAPTGLGLPPTGTEQYYDKQERDANNFLDDASAICKSLGITDFLAESTRAY